MEEVEFLGTLVARLGSLYTKFGPKISEFGNYLWDVLKKAIADYVAKGSTGH